MRIALPDCICTYIKELIVCVVILYNLIRIRLFYIDYVDNYYSTPQLSFRKLKNTLI